MASFLWLAAAKLKGMSMSWTFSPCHINHVYHPAALLMRECMSKSERYTLVIGIVISNLPSKIAQAFHLACIFL